MKCFSKHIRLLSEKPIRVTQLLGKYLKAINAYDASPAADDSRTNEL